MTEAPMRVTEDGVRLRSGPGTDQEILIPSMPANTVLRPITPYAWRQVVTEGGMVGWVAADYLTPALDADLGEQHYSLEELMPLFEDAGDDFGIDPRWLAAEAYQESGFTNWRVHRDGTGHGLFGLDDNGMLPAFEQWIGYEVGRGPTANIIAPKDQIRYTAMQIADYSARLGGLRNASAAWYMGEGGYRSPMGQHYADLIEAHVAELFGSG